MKSRLFVFSAMLSVLLLGLASLDVQGGNTPNGRPTLIANDADHDGVPDDQDLCPGEDASFFDRNGDGCIDDPAGARHIEYWGQDDTLLYVIQQAGAPGITNGSDFTELQNAFSAWTSIPGTDMVSVYGGTTAQEDANGLDQINLVTFKDDQYQFGASVLAVALTTSFTVDSTYNNVFYRPGQIVDADMIFNPNKTYRTSTQGGTGTYIQSVATHEAAHLYGISHTAIRSSTMSYVLPAGTNAQSLELDDELVFLKAYADSATRADATRLGGTVIDGKTQQPVPGAIVFLINAATGDTTACEFTLPDGNYVFLGVPVGSYYVSIYPLNGSSQISYLEPAYINDLVASTAVTVFVPEYYDAAESNSDDPTAKLAVAVADGQKVTGINITTNIDATGPVVTDVLPASNATDVRVDAAVLIEFDEPIDKNTISGNFHFRNVTQDIGLGGTATILRDDSVIAFTPSLPLEFENTYRVTIDQELTDKFGNGLANQYVSEFTTQPLPPLAIASLAPSNGVVGSIVVINGNGFAHDPMNNHVTFNGIPATVDGALPNRLIVTVPSDATTGDVVVAVGGETSNALTFTVLSQVEVARGFESGTAQFESLPRAIGVLPSGDYAYVATRNGVEAVVVSEGVAGYLTTTPIDIADGTDDLDNTPEGDRVYAVSRLGGSIHVIDSNPADGLLFNTVLATLPVGAQPLGIIIPPSGQRAYVPTDEGEIQVWDIIPTSATYQRQVGVIVPPEPDLGGKMAVDPAGEKLLALTTTGKLFVYDAGPDTLLAQITVGPNPRDVVVDPTGQRAYVTDGMGIVTVVSLSGLFKVQDITTGGSLRGVAITPAGGFLYAVNRQLNLIDVIDLNEQSKTFRSVAATIELGVNPVDIDVSPDGRTAFSLLEDQAQLTVTTIGLGPTLASLSRRAGPPGTLLVLSGTGFLEDSLLTVSFNGASATAKNRKGSSATVVVPPTAASGPVRVIGSDPTGPTSISNALYFEVLGPSMGETMRLADKVPGPPDLQFASVIAMSPLGDYALLGMETGEISFLDIDPESPTFNTIYKTVPVAASRIADIAITPDGERAFVAGEADRSVWAVGANRLSPSFGVILKTWDLAVVAPDAMASSLAIRPDGELLLVGDRSRSAVYAIAIPEITPEFEVILEIPLAGLYGSNGEVWAIGFHPSGLAAYLIMQDENADIMLVVDTDPGSANFLTVTAGTTVGSPSFPPYPTAPPYPWQIDLSFTPDGNRCFVYTEDVLVTTNRFIHTLDCSNPSLPYVTNIYEAGPTGTGARDHIDVSPRGDRAVYNATNGGFFQLGITGPVPIDIGAVFDYHNILTLDQDYAPDASRFYVASVWDTVYIYDFYAASNLSSISGDEQTGVAGQPTAAPLRVLVSNITQVGDTHLVTPIPGVIVTFKVVEGGGYFTDYMTAEKSVATDQDGIAEIDWTFGPVVGVQTQIVQVFAQGLTGSPVQFVGDSVEDPNTLPLTFGELLPLNGVINVSATTAILATFSRGVDPASVTSSTFYLVKQGDTTPIPVNYGFASGNKKVSLDPVSALEYGETYEVNITAGVTDEASGPLQGAPILSSFTVQPAPPLAINGVNPPSATVDVNIVVSGAGFDATASNNKVIFKNASASATGAGINYVKAKVPLGAISGPIRVAVGTDTSNALPFTVLIPSQSPIDDVIASVGTGSSTQGVGISPDGAIAYTTSFEGNTVIPIDIEGQTSYPSISVGQEPVAIAIHPQGTYAYVANFQSGSLSIIDIDPNSPTFHTVVETQLVGANPLDVAISPDGDRIYVANAGSSSLSVLDGDETSATHNQVIASVGVGASTQGVAISPDGAHLYVGTSTGYVVVETTGYTVVASVGTGASTQGVRITPDGALLIILTTGGDVLIVDVEPGSATQNQVVAKVGTGGTAQGVAVSPDGALLYLIESESDEIVVYALNVIGSVAAIEPTVIPPKIVETRLVNTFKAGEDPHAIAFDPTGTGVAVITNAGDKTVSIINGSDVPTGPLAARVRITPRTINLKSHGRWVEGRIEIPPSFPPEEIVLSTVELQDTVPADLDNWWIEDGDMNGVRELVVKFDRALFQKVIPQGEYVEVKVAGEVRNRTFEGLDTVRVIRPGVVFPKGGETLISGTTVNVTWTSPAGYKIDAVDVNWTPNDGEDWYPIATQIPDAGTVTWTVPDICTSAGRVIVTLFENGEDIGGGLSPGTFSIMGTVPVALGGFESAIVDRAVALKWHTIFELDTEGFHVLRSEQKETGYERITSEVIPSAGDVHGSSYEFRDETVRPNRTYYYQLQQATSTGGGQVFGPYEVCVRAAFELRQNAPNPFNPSTMIRFTVPEDAKVSLVVYDIAGHEVRTLVSGQRPANFYEVEWDGKDNRGQSVASGVYFYRLQAGKHVQTKKMMVLK
jgi:YVTN family beta-propeller protein